MRPVEQSRGSTASARFIASICRIRAFAPAREFPLRSHSKTLNNAACWIGMLHQILNLLRIPSTDAYRRAEPLILVNGLAEQGESWYLNRSAWQKHYDVHSPGVLVYDGQIMQERLARGEPIDIEFLTDRLVEYLDRFVQSPPYHLVASSLGAQSQSSMQLAIQKRLASSYYCALPGSARSSDSQSWRGRSEELPGAGREHVLR